MILSLIDDRIAINDPSNKRSLMRMIDLAHKRNNQGKLVVIYATHDYVKIYK